MIKSLPLQFTTLQRGPASVDGLTTRTNRLALQNSGAAPSWVLSTRIDFAEDTYGELEAGGTRCTAVQTQTKVGICVPNLEHLERFYGNGELDIQWGSLQLVLRTPVEIVGPGNPSLFVNPLIRPLPLGVGKGLYLNASPGGDPRTTDIPNWIAPWEVPGALGALDVAAGIEVPLLNDAKGRIFKFTLPESWIAPLLSGEYSGLRIGLKLDDGYVASVFRDSTPEQLRDGWETQPLAFANSTPGKSNLWAPELELGSLEQELDRSSAFVLDQKNLIGITFQRAGRAAYPEEIKPLVSPYPTSDIRALLIARLNVLYQTFEIVLNDDAYAESDSVNFHPSAGRLTTTTGIFEDLLPRTLVDLLGLTTEPDPSTIPYDASSESQEYPIPYDDPRFYEFWNSPLNAPFREDRPFVRTLGRTTLLEALRDGSPDFRAELVCLWQFKNVGGWETFAEKNLAVEALDPFDSRVSALLTEVYPRVSTVGLRRLWAKIEGPSKVLVYVDDRPPEQITNATLRGAINSRTSALYPDLAWGVCAVGTYGGFQWFIEPSNQTLLSHDGRYHWFWLDPNNLPKGSWRFEFRRLDTGEIVRQINNIEFNIT